MKTLLDILVTQGVIEKADIPKIQAEATDVGGDVKAVLQKRGIDEQMILKAQGAYLGIPVKSLEGEKVSFDTLKYIPEESATHYRFVPLVVNDGVLEVGIVDPDNAEARDVLNFISVKNKIPFKIFLITEEDFDSVIQSYKGLSAEVTKALSELESELSSEDIKMAKEMKEVEGGAPGKDNKESEEVSITEDAPVTKIVATILHYAVEGQASDVHVEHMGEQVRVRFRVDGVLHTSLVLPAKVHRAVVARIKILSSMRIDEKRKPQDGRFSAHILGRKIDFRVSTFPAYYGEKIVMRILDSEKGVRKLDDMGLSQEHVAMIREALQKPHGMILISGPTGSGKSTTLYSMLSEIDRESNNVLSLEDPVEYSLPGMNQSQVHPEIGYTFASGLRTTLRQDPDIIMVGEIRDKETAKLAVQATLTGHLVLSTIHTNDAAGVIPRLVNMEVDPYLIAPTLILAIAQRLVRRICDGGAKEIDMTESMQKMIDNQFNDLPEAHKGSIAEITKLYEAVPTKECPDGTRGRVAVMEAFKMTEELEKVILDNPTDLTVKAALRMQGMLSLREDALIKASQGLIPFEEVNFL